jgi:NAD(P)-dependent dehydrogenase (short-subunit alcohol dehydrogenase family)
MRMPLADLPQSAEHSFSMLLVGLAVPFATVDLLAGQALPGADVDLAQRRFAAHGHPEARTDDLGRLEGASQVARVDRVWRLVLERLGEALRLLAAELVQRRVGVSLEPAVAVPVCRPMSREEDRRHPLYASRPLDLGLRDRVCVVTGSTGGIGLASARLLVEEGAQVVVCGRDAERVELARTASGAALGVTCDLAEPSAPEQLIGEAMRALGRVDCLVNNVGDAYQADFEALSDGQWDEMWQLNVMSFVRAIRAVLPGMRERGKGAIVNVSSTSGKRPSTSMPNYSVTKAAVLSLSRLVADLYAGDGIRCNAVSPGPTATEAWLAPGGLADQQAQRTGKTREEVLESVAQGRPLGRLAEPEEIAAVVVFLCSDRANYVTGSAWSADGGTVPIIL